MPYFVTAVRPRAAMPPVLAKLDPTWGKPGYLQDVVVAFGHGDPHYRPPRRRSGRIDNATVNVITLITRDLCGQDWHTM